MQRPLNLHFFFPYYLAGNIGSHLHPGLNKLHIEFPLDFSLRLHNISHSTKFDSLRTITQLLKSET